jgi:hypothetical protein
LDGRPPWSLEQGSGGAVYEGEGFLGDVAGVEEKELGGDQAAKDKKQVKAKIRSRLKQGLEAGFGSFGSDRPMLRR